MIDGSHFKPLCFGMVLHGNREFIDLLIHTRFLDKLLFVVIIRLGSGWEGGRGIQMWSHYVVVLKLLLMLYVSYTSLKTCMRRRELGQIYKQC